MSINAQATSVPMMGETLAVGTVGAVSVGPVSVGAVSVGAFIAVWTGGQASRA